MRTLIVFFILTGSQLHAQFKIPTSVNEKTPYFERKFVAGFAVNNSWASYRDLLGDSAFYRPSLGIGIRAEYFFKPFIGVSMGAGIQQRGMGIYTKDYNNSIGDPDSTGRLRYRTTTYDFPIQLVLRTPKNILPSTRLSATVGADISYIKSALRIWKSVDDGFHVPVDLTNNFQRIDVLLRGSIGADVEAGSGCLFRAHFFGELSNKQLYTNPFNGTKSNQNILLGLDLSFLF